MQGDFGDEEIAPAAKFNLGSEPQGRRGPRCGRASASPLPPHLRARRGTRLTEPLAELRPRYAELSETSGLFLDPAAEALRMSPLQQLWREHMLAQSMLDARLYDRGYFILIAPALNYHAQDAAEAYQTHLCPPADNKVRFVTVTLEDVIAVL